MLMEESLSFLCLKLKLFSNKVIIKIMIIEKNKVINLKKDDEPEIFGAITKGAILENVIVNNGLVDFKKNGDWGLNITNLALDKVGNVKKHPLERFDGIDAEVANGPSIEWAVLI